MAERTLKIKVTMEERWIPEFIGMCELMEYNGKIGHSGRISFYADGDGDFRPKFDIKYSRESVGKSIDLAQTRSLNHWSDLLDTIRDSNKNGTGISTGIISHLAYSDAEFDAS